MDRSSAIPEQQRLPLTVSRPALLQNGDDRQFRSLVHDLLSLADQIVGIRNGFAGQLCLSGIQYTILTTIALLQDEQAALPADIAEKLHLSESFVAAEVARLIELGSVQARQRPDSKGEGFVLSPYGRCLLRRIAPIQQPVNDALFESLSREEFQALSRIVSELGDCAGRAKAVRDSLRGRGTLLPTNPAESREADIDPRAFRDGLGHFATGVAVVTAEAPNGNRVGMTISSFNSVSLSPPLVLFSIARNVLSLQDLEASQRYAVNILHSEQRELSNRFSRAGADKWAEVAVRQWTGGCPLLAESLAAFECVPYATYDGGDHVIFVGRVVRYETSPSGKPLLFFRGNYADLRDEIAAT